MPIKAKLSFSLEESTWKRGPGSCFPHWRLWARIASCVGSSFAFPGLVPQQTNWPQMRVAKMLHYVNTRILQQCFSKINVFIDHTKILLNRSQFSWSGVGPEFLHFKQVPRWSQRSPHFENISQWIWICVFSSYQASPYMGNNWI